jgi:hypothetical protein
VADVPDAVIGRWQVRRLSGLLPPMVGVRKRIGRDRGHTGVGPLPGAAFDVCADAPDRVRLVYRWPLSGLVDELRPGPGGAWRGRATYRGHELGRFEITPASRTPPSGRGRS